jgi:hypothetical protein
MNPSINSLARRRTLGSRSETRRTVNARDMIERRRLCRGGSM